MPKTFIVNLRETFFGSFEIEARNITEARKIYRAMLEANDIPGDIMNESGGYVLANIKEVPELKPKKRPTLPKAKQ